MERKFSVLNVAPMGIDHTMRPANQRESAPPEIEVNCKDDKVSAALQMARGKLLSSDAFFRFKAFFILNGHC